MKWLTCITTVDYTNKFSENFCFTEVNKPMLILSELIQINTQTIY
jgi:hypothetical protein